MLEMTIGGNEQLNVRNDHQGNEQLNVRNDHQEMNSSMLEMTIRK